ncbi:MAG: flagellin, partial [Terracidiphilus sp.]
NTNNSLNTVLQQLSSGSKINSGADDAAGLSLVNGLQANQTALAQSETNATEGVGLLQVADGALSQVTSLLNRAVTLATEASNGTLNSSQDTAANQEYQSILSEISNIGSTTTYNDEGVFGSNTNIYTGDSSTAGASIDDLNIRSMSSSNVGDTSGTMSYGTGASGSDVFVALGATTAADAEGAIGTGTTSTLDVSYLVGNTTKSTTITVGGTSGYNDTGTGLVQAINASGLGISASITTDKVAGAGASGDYGIEITGSVGSAATPSSNSFSGVVAAAGNTSAATADTKDGDDIMNGSLTLQVGNGAATTITTAEVATANGEAAGTVTMSQLASYITANTGLGVTAGVSASTGALDLNSTGSYSALKVNSNLTDETLQTGTGDSEATNYTATAAFSVGITNDATSSVETYGAATAAAVSTGTAGSAGGVATISYADQAGVSLSGTDLSNQTDAEAVLTSLNTAITDVAAQDGYVGAQINTLNAVSSVLSTQQENVQSAQNAVQSTDYASATSNMSKYEILSQTGIAALAQANSMQQEVTKLLQ